MKIVLSSKCRYWNLDIPYIRNHIDDVIYVKYVGSLDEGEERAPHQFEIEEYICCGCPNPGYNSEEYKNTLKAINNFQEMLEKGEDVIFLCDTSLASMYVFRAMMDKASEYNIHLVYIRMESGDMNNYFFGDRIGDRQQMQNKLLFIKDLKSVVCIKEGEKDKLDTNLFLENIVSQILMMKEDETYVYSHQQKKYEGKKITMKNIVESATELHSDFIINMLAGKAFMSDVEDKYAPVISQEVRSDGKAVCAILKKMRREIVEANNIDISIEECDYQGDCVGTCPKCEQEILLIENEMKNISEEDIIYPVFDIAAELEKLRKEH